MRGTTALKVSNKDLKDISIHVPREGDDEDAERWNRCVYISIHVPREGDDLGEVPGAANLGDFNPRPP